jgi:hypothetical protein
MNYFVNTDDYGLRQQYGNPSFQVVAGPGGKPTQLARLGQYSEGLIPQSTVIAILATAAAAGAYHGYKRSDSLGTAFGYGLAAFFFPVPVLAYSLGQGFAKPE